MISVKVKRTRRRINLARSMTVVTAKLAEEAKQEAVALTSGSVSTKQLRQMGHPFGRMPVRGRRKGRQRGTLARLPINRQSGELQKSLRVFRTSGGFRLQFTSPHAVVLSPGGTRRMVARGFWAEMRKRMAPRVKRAAMDIRRYW